MLNGISRGPSSKKEYFDLGANVFAENRILLSRLFSVCFLLLFFFTEPKLDDTVWEALLFFSGLVLVGIATVGRLWCSLYISGRKSTELVIHGPYSMCRHPLYFFSFLGVIGLGLSTEVISLAILLTFIFVFSYQSVIRSEEYFLEDKFADRFRSYREAVPRFFPKWRGHKELESLEVAPRIFLRSVSEALWFAGLVGLLEFLEAVKALTSAPSYFQLY